MTEGMAKKVPLTHYQYDLISPLVQLLFFQSKLSRGF
jgi:hypothetical protein